MIFPKSSQALMTAHGVLMTFGWSFFIVGAIIIARHFKTWGYLWFQLHIFLNVIGLVLIFSGFVISFVMVPKITLGNASRPVAIAHAYIGLFSVGKALWLIGLKLQVMGLIQPIIGWYSDKVYDKDRKEIPVWPDKIHWWLGRWALLLSFIAVPLGMVALNINRAFVWIYIAYVVVLFTVFILLQKTKGNKHEMELQTINSSESSNSSEKGNSSE